MKDLRNEAIALLTTMPEKYLPSVISLMQGLNEVPEIKPIKSKKKINLDDYVNKGERMFKSTEEIDEYIKESRREREF